MSPSSCWLGLSVFRLRTDNLLAAALRALTSNRLLRLTRCHRPVRGYAPLIPAFGRREVACGASESTSRVRAAADAPVGRHYERQNGNHKIA